MSITTSNNFSTAIEHAHIKNSYKITSVFFTFLIFTIKFVSENIDANSSRKSKTFFLHD